MKAKRYSFLFPLVTVIVLFFSSLGLAGAQNEGGCGEFAIPGGGQNECHYVQGLVNSGPYYRNQVGSCASNTGGICPQCVAVEANGFTVYGSCLTSHFSQTCLNTTGDWIMSNHTVPGGMYSRCSDWYSDAVCCVPKEPEVGQGDCLDYCTDPNQCDSSQNLTCCVSGCGSNPLRYCYNTNPQDVCSSCTGQSGHVGACVPNNLSCTDKGLTPDGPGSPDCVSDFICCTDFFPSPTPLPSGYPTPPPRSCNLTVNNPIPINTPAVISLNTTGTPNTPYDMTLSGSSCSCQSPMITDPTGHVSFSCTCGPYTNQTLTATANSYTPPVSCHADLITQALPSPTPDPDGDCDFVYPAGNYGNIGLYSISPGLPDVTYLLTSYFDDGAIRRYCSCRNGWDFVIIPSGETKYFRCICQNRNPGTIFFHAESTERDANGTPLIWCNGSTNLDVVEKGIWCEVSDTEDGVNSGLGCLRFYQPSSFVSQVLPWAIGIGGLIAFLALVYAGYLISTSGGNPKKVSAGKELATSIIVGLIYLAVAVVLLNLIGANILKLNLFGFSV